MSAERKHQRQPSAKKEKAHSYHSDDEDLGMDHFIATPSRDVTPASKTATHVRTDVTRPLPAKQTESSTMQMTLVQQPAHITAQQQPPPVPPRPASTGAAPTTALTPNGRRRVPKVDVMDVVRLVYGKNGFQPTQNVLYIQTSAKALGRLYWHALNRDVHMPHVQVLRMKLVESLLSDSPDPVELTVALLKTDLADYIEDPTNNDVKLAVLDGQHRMTALEQMVESAATRKQTLEKVCVLLKVFICEDAEHLSQRVETLNLTHKWSTEDNETVAVRSKFIQALDNVLGDEMRGRKPTKAVANSQALRDKAWTRPLWGKDVAWFEKEIRKLAESEAAQEWKAAASQIPAQRVLGKAIALSKLWQLADTTHNWVKLIQVEPVVSKISASRPVKRPRANADK